MRAEIFKIEEDTIKAITSNDGIINIPKDKIGFEYSIGDFIVIEKENGKESYSLLKNTEKSDKRKNNKPHKARIAAIVVIVLLLIAGAIATAIIVPKKIEENRISELNKGLNNCLLSGYKKIYPNSNVDISSIRNNIFSKPLVGLEELYGEDPSMDLASKKFDMAITCYNNYHVNNYQNIIDELESLKNEADLSICVDNAQHNNLITEEEVESSKYDMVKTIALLTRLSNGYQEQINCYEKYNTEESETKIGELKIKKNETDSYIESAKNSSINTDTGSSNTYFHCTTNTIGNYTYTNCY